MTRILLLSLLIEAGLPLTLASAQPTAPVPVPGASVPAHGQTALPPGVIAQLGSSRFQFGEEIGALQFTHGGKRLLVEGKSFCLFDANSGQPLRRWQRDVRSVGSWTLSPDGRLLALARHYQHTRSFRVEEVATGKLLFQVTDNAQSGFDFLAFAPNGKYLAALYRQATEGEWPKDGEPGHLRLWETATGKEIPLPSKDGIIMGAVPIQSDSLTFSPDGKYLAAVGAEGKEGVLRVWHTTGSPKTWRQRRKYRWAGPVAFAPDGKQLAECDEHRIRLWNAATGQLLRQINVPNFWGCNVLVYSPNGKYLAVGSGPKVKVWHVASGKPVAQTADLMAFHFAPDSKTFATLDNEEIRVFATDTGKVLHRWPGRFYRPLIHFVGRGLAPPYAWRGEDRALAYTPDSSELVTADFFTGSLVYLDVATGKERAPTGAFRGLVFGLEFGPDGRTLAVAGAAGVSLWDVRSGRPLRTLARNSGTPPGDYGLVPGQTATGVVYAPDGRQVAARWGDGTFTMWETSTGRQLWRQQYKANLVSTQSDSPQEFIQSAAPLAPFVFAPDSGLFLHGDLKQAILWRHPRTGDVVRTIDVPTLAEPEPDDPFQRSFEPDFQPILAVSPDGRTFVGSFDTVINLGELTTGKIRRPVRAGPILTMSRNGRRLAALLDLHIAITDLYSAQGVRHIAVPKETVALALSPDGSLLVTGGLDGSLRLWDIATGTLLTERGTGKKDPEAQITALTFSRDGKLIASANMNTTILIWDVARLRSGTRKARTRADRLLDLGLLAAPDAAAAGQALARLADDPQTVAFLREQFERQALQGKNALQATRTVELLERIGTSQAQRLLDLLAKDRSLPIWSAEARVGLQRLVGRSAPLSSAAVKVPTGKKGNELPAEALARLGSRPFQHGAAVATVRFLPDGKTLLTGANFNDDAINGRINCLQSWDSQTGDQLHKIDLAGKQILQGFTWGGIGGEGYNGSRLYPGPWCVSPNGRILAVAPGGFFGGSRPIQLLDLTTGKSASKFEHEAFASHFFRFTPNGKSLAAMTGDPKAPICILSVGTGLEIGRLQLAARDTKFLPFHFIISPTGRYLTVVGRDAKTFGAIRLWDLQKDQPAYALADRCPRFSPLAFSPNGKLLAVVTQRATDAHPRLRLYDAATGNVARDLGEHPEARPEKGNSDANIVMDVSSETQGLIFSPNGQWLVLLGFTRVYLWQVNEGKQLPGQKLAGRIRAASFAPDNRRLAIRHDEGITLVSTSNWEQLHQIRLKLHDKNNHLPSGEQYFFQAEQGLGWPLTFSPNSQRLLVMDGRTIRQWEVSTGQEIRAKVNHPMPASLVASPDGTAVAALSRKGIILWHQSAARETPPAPDSFIVSAVLLNRRTRDAAEPCTAAFSPSGNILATGQANGEVILREVPGGKRLRILQGHDNHLVCLRFSPDGKRLRSIDRSFTQIEWDVASGRCLATVLPPRTALPNRTSPQGQSDHAQHALLPDEIGMSPDNRLCAFPEYHSLSLFELATGQARRKVPFGDANPPVVFAPDGRFLVYRADLAYDESAEYHYVCKGLVLLDVLHGRKVRFFGPLPRVTSAAFSPDGRLLAATGMGGLWVWETASARLLAHKDEHRGPDTAVAFSADGRRLFAAGVDGTILVWDVAALTRTERYPEPAPAELERLWDDLGNATADRAFAALLRLSQHPARAVALLQAKIQPVPPLDQPRLQRLISDLDQASFKVRSRATVELEQLGELARPALQQALLRNLSLEHRQRIEQLLSKLAGAPPLEQVRSLRVIELLELVATPGSRKLLTVLAQGNPASPSTQAAQASLRRLEEVIQIGDATPLPKDREPKGQK